MAVAAPFSTARHIVQIIYAFNRKRQRVAFDDGVVAIRIGGFGQGNEMGLHTDSVWSRYGTTVFRAKDIKKERQTTLRNPESVYADPAPGRWTIVRTGLLPGAIKKTKKRLKNRIFGTTSQLIMDTNIISPTAIIGKNVQIGHFCIIEDDVVIGDNTIVKSYVELRKGTVVGENCYIDSKVSSSGNCVIGNNVTIRYDSIIARGVRIGNNTYISPKTMTNNVNTEMNQIGGAHIGENVFIGTNCVLQHGIRIGDNSVLGSMSFINKDVPDNEVWFGNPAVFYKKI